MLCFDTTTHRFQLRAAAIIGDSERVLLSRAEGDDFWALPGGRVEPGETAAAAVTRELREELGLETTAGPLRIVTENFFAYQNRQYHEVGLYLGVEPAAGSQILRRPGPYVGVEEAKGLTFEWFARSRLCEIDLRPTFLKATLANPAQSFAHVIHRDVPANGPPL